MMAKNREILHLLTSTGTLVVGDSAYLFVDHHSGFSMDSDEKCFFFNNLHHEMWKEKAIRVFHFFYYYPIIKEKKSLTKLFREFLSSIDITDLDELDSHQYHPFIWEIGQLHIGSNFEQPN